MKVLQVRNVHQALSQGLYLMDHEGQRRDSRNGPVLQTPWPVVTIYDYPLERVIFWPQREANPFLHLYESLWMLAGRKDVTSLSRYASKMKEFSDDGKTLNGAYGHRWTEHFGKDQLPIIADRLKNNPDDRRCVLGIWDPSMDLGSSSKDVPCNVLATFQRDSEGKLNMVVFCRSNDIIWGAYGANAVHFSFILEYMALMIGCEVGSYTQASVNWHSYVDTFETVRDLPRMSYVNPYADDDVRPLLMPKIDKAYLDFIIDQLLKVADDEFQYDLPKVTATADLWTRTIYCLLRAHHLWKTLAAPERFNLSMEVIYSLDQKIDFVVACRQWLERRLARWQKAMDRQEIRSAAK